MTDTNAGFVDLAETADRNFQQTSAREALKDWIIPKVQEWEKDRQQKLDVEWQKYLKKWSQRDDQKKSVDGKMKRSNLVSPALTQAVEDAAADIEESILGKEAWFDLSDDFVDQKDEGWQKIRKMLLDDADEADVPGALMENFFLGALYGTMIGKVVVEEATMQKLAKRSGPNKGETTEGVDEETFVRVKLEPVLPYQFVIDTAVNRHGKAGIEMALGMAHRLYRPKHIIVGKQHDEIKDEGEVAVEATYYQTPLLAESAQDLTTGPLGTLPVEGDESVLITEYHGLVPRALLEAAIKDKSKAPDEIDTRDMVESIVTIANDAFLLKARENKTLKGKRAFVAAPWDVVPGSFWGRGIGDKAYTSQETLDEFLRGQVDAMKYSVYPMMGIDNRRIPARVRLEWGPGREIRVNGPPSEALQAITMPTPAPGTFVLTGEMERHIQMATGTTGSGGQQARGSQGTLGGQSIAAAGLVKRTNRTIRLISKNFLNPLVEVMYLRQVEFNQEKYQFNDVTFRVRSAAGMIAREVENQQIVQMLQFIPPGSGPFWLLLGRAVENMGAKDKGEMAQAIGQLVNQSQQPNPQEQIEEARSVADLKEVQTRTTKKEADTMKTAVETEALLREEGNNDRGTSS